MQNTQTDTATHIHKTVESILPDLVALRHDFHRHPELAYQEKKTSARVLRELESIGGLEIRTGLAETGITATLRGKGNGMCVALRADMDALPLQEINPFDYKSQVPNRMHACGHDGHMTCLVGAARVLSSMKESLPGHVKFVFQPAEESGAGGKRMVDEGALDDPKVDAAFAMHGWPDARLGTLIVGTGPILAAASAFTVELQGAGAHAAYPHKGQDVIVAAAYLVNRMQSVVSRLSDPVEPIVVSICAIHGGDAHNVLPDSCRMLGTLRTLTQASHDRTRGILESLVASESSTAGLKGSLTFHESYPSLVNHPDAAQLVRDVGDGLFGKDHVVANPAPSMGGEDFAFFANRVPSAMWRLGLCPEGSERYPHLHQPNFDFPDSAIPLGVEMHCRVALRFLEKGFGGAG